MRGSHSGSWPGATPRDTRWVDAPLVGASLARPIKVAIVPKAPGGTTHPAQHTAVRGAGRHLEAAGYPVEEVCRPASKRRCGYGT
jgi:amidase